MVGSTRNAPLIAHVIYRLDVGGLENGLVNLINHMPPGRFRHAIICLTDHTEFRRRIERDDVQLFALDKPPGNSLLTQVKLWRLLMKLRPAVIHTRNLAALECTLAAFLAGVPVRIHGEHGRDVGDLDGSNPRFQRMRRLFKPFVHHYIALSRDLEKYLHERVHVPDARVTQLFNGVDTQLFHPAALRREPLPRAEFAPENAVVIGTVGRMQAVKDQLTLVRAFARLLRMAPSDGPPTRLVMVGDGPMYESIAAAVAEEGIAEYVWLAGERNDVPEIMRALDIFVLPSLAEGISNTILEAMASGLPVVATSVGGNPELVEPECTGALVPSGDVQAMADALRRYCREPTERKKQGRQARRVAEHRYSMATMVSGYLSVYDRMLNNTDNKKAHSCAES